MPFTRPRSAADIMTRSLMPSYDAGASVLSEYLFNLYIYFFIVKTSEKFLRQKYVQQK